MGFQKFPRLLGSLFVRGASVGTMSRTAHPRPGVVSLACSSCFWCSHWLVFRLSTCFGRETRSRIALSDP